MNSIIVKAKILEAYRSALYVVISSIILSLFFSIAFAQTGPVGTALSGPASAKSGINPELMLSNPASLSAAKNVYLGTITTFGNSGRLELTRNISLRNTYSVYVVDRGSDLLLPLSLFYTRSYLDIRSPMAQSDMSSVYVATVFDITPTLSLGAGYYRSNLGDSNSNYLKLGTIYAFSETVSFGASYHQDIFNNNTSDNAISLGARVLLLNKINVFLDLTRRSWTYTIRSNDGVANRNSMISLALENKISDFIIRLGVNTPFSKDIKDAHFSCGLGFEGPKIGVDYGLGYYRPVTNNTTYESIREFTHSFDLNIYF